MSSVPLAGDRGSAPEHEEKEKWETTVAQSPEQSFIYVRHGQTDFNRRGLLAGSTDVGLTDQGIREAEEAAALLAGESFGHVFVSPLRRAQDTARIIAARHGLSLTTMEAFRERNWGELEGKAFPRDLGHPHPPGGEEMKEFLKRIGSGIEEVLETTQGRGVLIVAHGGVCDALCRVLCGSTTPPLVGNAVPIRFDRRAESSGLWTMQSIQGEGR